MATKICECCGQNFQPHHKVPNQTYCSSPDCQQERRHRWEKDKQKNDPDYRDNKSRAQRAWVNRNPDYWRKYRKSKSDTGDKPISSPGQTALIAALPVKMNHLVSLKNFPAGIYRIKPIGTADRIAKFRNWVVEITPVCIACPCQDDDCQDRM